MQLSNYLTKNYILRKVDFWGRNPIDSHSFCTRPRAPPHGRVTAASPEPGSNQPVPICSYLCTLLPSGVQIKHCSS